MMSAISLNIGSLLAFIICGIGNILFRSTLANNVYKNGEKVILYVNKVGPYSNPQETYHYYHLPVCRPLEVVHKKLSLAELMNGDRMAESIYNISFRVDTPKTALCNKFQYKASELISMLRAIEANYYFEFIIDNIILRNFLGNVEEISIFPHKHKVFLFTHHHFIFEYNNEEIVHAKILIDRERPHRIDNAFENNLPVDVTFTYSVEWKESKVRRSQADIVHDSFFPKSFEIHWLSVINSSLLVFLLLAFVVLIMIRIIRSDLSKYNFGNEKEANDFDDHGWKVIHGDVFRSPKYLNMLCAILGVGVQLLTITATILLIVLFSLIDEHTHGLINVAALVLYALTSGIAGYVSSSMYKKLGGERWIFNINLTFGLFSVPTFMVWSIENSISWAYKSTQALPYQTVVLLLALWTLIGYPLTVVGGVLGKNFPHGFCDVKNDVAAYRVRQIPRELPSALGFYHSPLAYGFVGGFLSFRSTGFFVLTYALFFYCQRSQMSGFFQTSQFFGYVFLVCYGFFISLGTVSFFASWKFVQYIYSNIKTE
uniref:Transmembrane 9 superfamily member n=1 Tax=Romanomermis culicivorax TaxID=13658 RepID=A0A915IV59_ROMCU